MPAAIRSLLVVLAVVLLATAAGACDAEDDVAPDDPGEPRGPALGGGEVTIDVDATSILLPLAKRLQDRVGEDRAGLRVRVSTHDTATALTRLCLGDVVVAAVERRPTAREDAICARNRIQPFSILIGHRAVMLLRAGGLSVDCLTSGQVRELWRAGSNVERYADLGAGLPDRPVSLYGPPLEVSTPDFFSMVAVGREGDLRREVEFVEDRRALRRSLSAEPAAVAFGDLDEDLADGIAAKPVAVDAGDGCVAPKAREVRAGDYPLRRPLYLVAAGNALEAQPVERLVRLPVERTTVLTGYRGVVSLSAAEAGRQAAKLAALDKVEDERE